jgi:carbon storage regulator
MLVLNRHEQERIYIGRDIVITVVRIDSDSVRIGIDAPMDMVILRDELIENTSPRDGDGSA